MRVGSDDMISHSWDKLPRWAILYLYKCAHCCFLFPFKGNTLIFSLNYHYTSVTSPESASTIIDTLMGRKYAGSCGSPKSSRSVLGKHSFLLISALTAVLEKEFQHRCGIIYLNCFLFTKNTLTSLMDNTAIDDVINYCLLWRLYLFHIINMHKYIKQSINTK